MEMEPPTKFEKLMFSYSLRRFSGLVINIIIAHCLLTIFLTGCLGLPRAAAIETMMIVEPAKAHPRDSEGDIVELKDGRLCLVCSQFDGETSDRASANLAMRTSDDAGDRWSELRPSPLASPRSPATIKRNPFNGNLVCVWNDHSGFPPFFNGKRTPLYLASSADEGQAWSPSRVIEDDRDGWHCYASMAFQEGQFFSASCAGDKKVDGLDRLKVLAVAQSNLEQTGARKENARPATALLQPVWDYGRSFINTKANFNSPRFWVESRCRLTGTATEKSVEYYQCGSCKSEDTFAEQDLFLPDNYDFLPVLSADDGIVFRHHLTGAGKYREVPPINEWWGAIVPKLRSAKARVLQTSQEIFEAMEQGKPIVGQAELRDKSTGRIAVLEYPVKTINWHRDKKLWQVDAGPVLLPDLTVPPDAWPQTIQLAYIALNRSDRADFVVKKPTPIVEANTKSWHYSEIVYWRTRNVLLAIDDWQVRAKALFAMR
jgi:hypothetical protein